MNATSSSSRLITVDLLRIFAAAIVMVFHLGFWSWAPKTSTPKSVMWAPVEYPELVAWTWWGWVGVQIFFVISGYVIAFSSERVDWQRFLRSRFLRLAPGLWICASATVAIALLVNWEPAACGLGEAYLRTVTLFPDSKRCWVDGVYWTLGVEVSFYLLVMVLIAVGAKRAMEPIIAAVGVVSIVYTVGRLGLDFLPTTPNWGRVGQLLLVQHGMYFAIGVSLWAAHRHGWTALRVVFIILMTCGGLVPIIDETVTKSALLTSIWDTPSASLIWLVSVALMVMIPRLERRLAGSGPRLVAAIRILGLATYPLYLLHSVIGTAALSVPLGFGVERFVALALAMASMVALAVAITVWPEAAFRKWLGRWLGSASPDRAVSRRRRLPL